MTSGDDVRDRALAALDLVEFHRAGISPGVVVDAVLAAAEQDGTVEMAVACDRNDGKRELYGESRLGYDSRRVFADLRQRCPYGTHSLVQRSVGPWRPVEEQQQ